VTAHGFVGLASMSSEGAAMKVFNDMDTNGGGVITFVEFCEFIKRSEIAASTETGKSLAEDEPEGAGKAPDAAAPAGGKAGGGSKYSVGDKVMVRFGGGDKYFSAQVARVGAFSNYDVAYDDGDFEEGVEEALVKVATAESVAALKKEQAAAAAAAQATKAVGACGLDAETKLFLREKGCGQFADMMFAEAGVHDMASLASYCASGTKTDVAGHLVDAVGMNFVQARKLLEAASRQPGSLGAAARAFGSPAAKAMAAKRKGKKSGPPPLATLKLGCFVDAECRAFLAGAKRLDCEEGLAGLGVKSLRDLVLLCEGGDPKVKPAPPGKAGAEAEAEAAAAAASAADAAVSANASADAAPQPALADSGGNIDGGVVPAPAPLTAVAARKAAAAALDAKREAVMMRLLESPGLGEVLTATTALALIELVTDGSKEGSPAALVAGRDEDDDFHAKTAAEAAEAVAAAEARAAEKKVLQARREAAEARRAVAAKAADARLKRLKKEEDAYWAAKS